MSTTNPLLQHDRLPRFDQIQASDVLPGIEQALERAEADLKALEEQAAPTWEGLMEPLERLTEPLSWAWRLVTHLTRVRNSPELREAHRQAQPKVVAFWTQLQQSRPLYDRMEELRNGPLWEGLGEARQRVVRESLLGAYQSGVGLDGEARQRFKEGLAELAELQTEFRNNMMDSRDGWSRTLRDVSEVEGLPESLLAQMSAAARRAGEADSTAEGGPWRVTLDFHIYRGLMGNSASRALREEVQRAWTAVASEADHDNMPVLERILELRREQALELGYSSYAEQSLAQKMAAEVEEIEALFGELRAAASPAARREIEELRQLAAEHGAPEADDFRIWDLFYWSERLREARYDYSEEEIRAWFQLPRVLEGLFALVERLFGVRIVPADGEAPVWHEDVRLLRLEDADGTTLASLYLDLYARPGEKLGGAWQSSCQGRSRVMAPPGESVRQPVSYIVCNQAPPLEGQPALMTFREVTTLFHEFGHGLHHLLTTVDEGFCSGTRGVEWDAIEVPSTFMERWVAHRDTLRGLTAHAESGEPMPEALLDRLLESRNHMAGRNLMRQLYLSSIDLELHHRYSADSPETPAEINARVEHDWSLTPNPPESCFLTSFAHIFAGGYAAGYYSYKWAEVMSADLFAAFEEEGLDDPETVTRVGGRLRETLFALGGSRAPMSIFTDFRRRPPRIDPLLRHLGLVQVAA